MAAAVDDLSNGRLVLGLGAGWQEREHANYGWDLLDMKGRFSRFEEGLEVINRLLRSDTPTEFSGKYFSLKDAILLPRTQRPGGPPILIGGNGVQRTLPLVARFAQEWNAVYITPQEFQRLNSHLDELLLHCGRPHDEVKRSMMSGCVFGRNSTEVRTKVKLRTQGKRNAARLRQNGLVVGTASEIREQLNQFSAAGVQQIMLQWQDLDDIDGLEALAKGVLAK
jgi:alkanesulfonate monooxygenase SsuD/methylene tetrahydromethanopterin reductase-like flavin-dependent oxidoreductase (luciferase family)